MIKLKNQGKQLRNFLRHQRTKITAAISLAFVMSMSICSLAFASAPSTTDFSSITTAVTSKVTVAEVSALIGAVIAGGIGFVILWWGARKLVRAIIGAFKSGKIRF